MILKQNKTDNISLYFKIKTKIRFFLCVFLIPLIIYSIGIFPILIWLVILFYLIPQNVIIYFLIIPILLLLSIYFLLVSEILISGVIIRLFKIYYEEGTYEYTFNNNMAFKWVLICQLYSPIRKIFETIPMGPIKTVYLRLIGMKIGKNSLIGGTIKDPCMTDIGNNVTIGEYAILYSHIHNMEKETITIKKIKIGNNCIIGAGAIVMPGVKLEDNSILGAGGIVPKNQVLKKDKIYVGNPAKEIIKKRNEK